MPKELVSTKPRECLLREYEEAPLKDDHVRVKTLFASPKHGTELHLFRGDDPFQDSYYDEAKRMFLKKEGEEKKAFFMKPGNMWVGEIIEIGKNVSGFQEGQRVAGYGSLRETHVYGADWVLKMNSSMTWKDAVCYDPAQFALGGVRDSRMSIGDNVVVFGLGAIGLIAAQLAKKAGAGMVIAVDPIEKRRQAALKAGADAVIDPLHCDAGQEIKRLTGFKGADAAIETSASYPALQQAIRGLAYEGNIAVVGWYSECRAGLNFGMEAHFNQPNIYFSRACSEPNRRYPAWNSKRIEEMCWKMVSEGWLKTEDIVDPVVPFSDVAQAYMDIDRNPDTSVKLGVRF